MFKGKFTTSHGNSLPRPRHDTARRGTMRGSRHAVPRPDKTGSAAARQRHAIDPAATARRTRPISPQSPAKRPAARGNAIVATRNAAAQRRSVAPQSRMRPDSDATAATQRRRCGAGKALYRAGRSVSGAYTAKSATLETNSDGDRRIRRPNRTHIRTEIGEFRAQIGREIRKKRHISEAGSARFRDGPRRFDGAAQPIEDATERGFGRALRGDFGRNSEGAQKLRCAQLGTLTSENHSGARPQGAFRGPNASSEAAVGRFGGLVGSLIEHPSERHSDAVSETRSEATLPGVGRDSNASKILFGAELGRESEANSDANSEEIRRIPRRVRTRNGTPAPHFGGKMRRAADGHSTPRRRRVPTHRTAVGQMTRHKVVVAIYKHTYG